MTTAKMHMSQKKINVMKRIRSTETENARKASFLELSGLGLFAMGPRVLVSQHCASDMIGIER